MNRRWLIAMSIGVAVAALSSGKCVAQPVDVKVESEVEKLLGKMTLEEKIDVIGGKRTWYVQGNERLGVPELAMTDGPVGPRVDGPSTAYPAEIALAATWNLDLARRFGRSLGRDTRARGRHFILGPAMDMYRLPIGGRNAEYLGEDPYLTGRMATEIARAVQEEGVVATLKHFVCNDQEFQRRKVSAEVDERALREIYLRPFEMAVKEARPWAVMGAYNRLNGVYCCADDWLLNQVLKKEWGFQGIVMSDWGAAMETLGCVNGGLDLDMGKGKSMNREMIFPLMKDGKIKEATIDEKVRRILRVTIAMGFMNHKQKDESVPLDDPQGDAVALEEAQEGIVLLKNEHELLPLDREHVKEIVVLGPNAEPAVTGIGGSSIVRPFHSVSALEGIRKAAGEGVNVTQVPFETEGENMELVRKSVVEKGWTGEVFANRNLAGDVVFKRTDEKVDFDFKNNGPGKGLGGQEFSIRWSGKIRPAESGRYAFTLGSDDGSRMFLDGELLISQWSNHRERWLTKTARLEGGKTYDVRIEYFNGQAQGSVHFGWGKAGPAVREAMQKQVTEADAAIVCVGFNHLIEMEGKDRPYELSAEQRDLIEAVEKLNPRTIVVLNAGGNVGMSSWVDGAAGLIQAWYPGQEGGRAIGEILFGDVNPSGRLPATFEKKWEDCPAAKEYPGVDEKMNYREGIFVGYRHFDRAAVEPRYAFGYGLSYTTFTLGKLNVETVGEGEGRRIEVTCEVTNTGKRAGKEVVQVYVGQAKASVERPVRELKGFEKVELKAGETKTVKIEMDSSALAYWDVGGHAWKVEPGEYRVWVGRSSRELELEGKLSW